MLAPLSRYSVWLFDTAAEDTFAQKRGLSQWASMEKLARFSREGCALASAPPRKFPGPGILNDRRTVFGCARYTAAVAASLGVLLRICGIALALFAVGACAHKQTFRLDCVPKDVTIYLDKVPLDDVPDSIDLRTDQPHVLFIKGEGYEPTMVVLDTQETPDGPALSPRDVCFDLNFAKRSRELELEIEE
jgi:hypothetical protein